MEQITCDLIPGGKMPLLHASQYDEGREYRINLTENKQAYTLDGTELLTVSVRKGDNTLFTADIANTFGGKSYVDFVSTEQMCAVAGYNFGELSITKNNTRIGTINFMLVCEPSPEASGLTSESEINNLNRQIDDYLDETLPDVLDDDVPPIVERVIDETLAPVAKSGNYNDLENKPSIPAAQVNSDWNSNSGVSQILNKPNLSTVATSGDYNDLNNKPSVAVIDDTTSAANKTYSSNKINSVVSGLIDDTQASASKVYSSNKIDNLVNPLTEFPSDKYWNDNALKGKLHRTFEGITTDFDVASLKPEQGKTYYIKPNGSDSNSGLDREHPLQKLSTAIAKNDVQTIIVMDGIYNAGRIGGSFSKGLNIIADENAHPVFVVSRDKSWSATAGRTNVYETTDSSSTFYRVVKLDTKDADGDYLHYKRVESLDDVEATENSWYSSGNTVYVHSESTPTKLYVIVGSVNLHATLSNGETIYIEGCDFIGGNYGAVRVTNDGTTKPTVLLKNCGFSDSPLGNSLYLQGCKGILQNCYASYGSADGFNYHAVGDYTPESIEINCIGRHNGTIGNNTNNGSTSHESAKIIRLNCEYFDNIGPNIADVNDGTLSFNYGVVSHDSAGGSTNQTNFQCQSSVMYCDTCSAYNSDYNFQAYLNGIMYLKNCSGSIDMGSDGKALAY